MKILVIGGGVAGPAFCLFCKKFGVNADITIIERAPEFRNIGFGITLWGNGRKILDKLDMLANLDDKKGYEIPWDVFETPKHKFLQIFYFDIFKKFGPTVTITRSELQHGLVEGMNKENIPVRLGTTAKILHNDKNGVSVEFSDGTLDTFDLLVSADGIHSATRNQTFGEDKLKPYGVTAWITWMPENLVGASGVVAIAGNGKTVMTFPVDGRSFVMFISEQAPSEPETVENRKALLHKLFDKLGPSAKAIIDSISAPETILRDNLCHVEMDEWYKDRTVLIGDAQHALSPATGMGASFALEDAYVLAEELSRNTVDMALPAFVERRKERITMVKNLSNLLNTWVVTSGFKAFLRDNFLPFVPIEYFVRGYREILSKDI